jgi:hypothetical protein
VVRIPVHGLPVLPREVAWFEHALACLGGTGLAETRKASVVLLVAGYVRNATATEADIEAAVRASGQAPDEWLSYYAGLLGRLAGPERFPALRALLAAGVFDTADDPEEEFGFGLDRILDGVGVLIQASSGSPDRHDGTSSRS